MAMEGAGASRMTMMQQKQSCCDVPSAGRRWHGRHHRVSRGVQLNCFPRHPSAGRLHVRLLKFLAHFLQWLEYVQAIKRSPSPDQVKSSDGGVAGRRCAATRRPSKSGSCRRPLVLEQQQKQQGRSQLIDARNHHEDDAIADCLEFIKRSWGTVNS